MKDETKKSNLFTWSLIISIILVAVTGGYESYMQRYRPDYSILSHLHRFDLFKEYPVTYEPSKGIWHPVGWAGSIMMITMMLYSIRKRTRLFGSFGHLRYWLAAHMVLGVLGPILVTFHTNFKFRGIIATSYWAMVITTVFGFLGRYIYVQIPRSMAGAALKVNDIERIIAAINCRLGEYSNGVNITEMSRWVDLSGQGTKDDSLANAFLFMLKADILISYRIFRLNRILKRQLHLPRSTRRKVDFLLKKKASLIRKGNYLITSHRLLHYWHIVHIPLAVVMFLIMILHIVVYYLFSAGTA